MTALFYFWLISVCINAFIMCIGDDAIYPMVRDAAKIEYSERYANMPEKQFRFFYKIAMSIVVLSGFIAWIFMLT